MATRLALLLVALLSAVAQSYKLPSRIPKMDSRCSRRREVIGGAMLVGWQLLGAPALAADSDAAREAAAAFASLSPAELRKLQADADKQGYKDLCQFYLSRYNVRSATVPMRHSRLHTSRSLHSRCRMDHRNEMVRERISSSLHLFLPSPHSCVSTLSTSRGRSLIWSLPMK